MPGQPTTLLTGRPDGSTRPQNVLMTRKPAQTPHTSCSPQPWGADGGVGFFCSHRTWTQRAPEFTEVTAQRPPHHNTGSSEDKRTQPADCRTHKGTGMGLKLLPGRKLARMAFMVDFSFTWLSAEPSRCPSNTSKSQKMQTVRSGNTQCTGSQRFRKNLQGC